MKKFLAITLIAVCAVSLSLGCKKADKAAAPATPAAATEDAAPADAAATEDAATTDAAATEDAAPVADAAAPAEEEDAL